MKLILPILLLLLTGCAMRGTKIIHSPSSAEGSPFKSFHVHGGATRTAPPSGIIFQTNDSIKIYVSAQTISDRTNWGGILFPIFPLFGMGRINFYEDQPNSLILMVGPWNSEAEVQVKSATIQSGEQAFELLEAVSESGTVMLKFALPAEQTEEFELSQLSVIVNDKPTQLPPVGFKKMKQRWSFLGP